MTRRSARLLSEAVYIPTPKQIRRAAATIRRENKNRIRRDTGRIEKKVFVPQTYRVSPDLPASDD